MASNKPAIDVTPDVGAWESRFEYQASADRIKGSPWVYYEVKQNGVVVAAGYAKGFTSSFQVGPTPSADESQPGQGTAWIGQYHDGDYRKLASTTFSVSPSS